MDQYGWSPLHLAYKRGRNDIAKLLLRHEANKDKVSENHEAQTPADIINNNGLLHKAVWHGYDICEVDHLIKQGANVNYMDQYGWSPLHLALRKGNITHAKLLVQAGADKYKISENREAQTPADIIKVNGLILDLNNPIPNFTFSTNKEQLILYKGPGTHHQREITTDSKHNLFHPNLLQRYFEVIEFTDFTMMLSFMKESKLTPINLILEVHGMGGYNHYQLSISKTNTISFSKANTISSTYYTKDFNYNAKDLLIDLINASNDKPLKIFSTACFGENLHICNDKLSQEMPKGSVMITLSKKDRVTDMFDTCHPDMYKILDILLLGNKNSGLKLEDLLEAYCLSQRFIKNTPTISTFDGKTQKIIALNDYFNNKLLRCPEINISLKLEGLLNIKKLVKEDLVNIVKELQHSEDNLKQNSLFEMPNSISDITVLFKAIENKNLGELFKLYSTYYTKGSLDKVFLPDTFVLDNFLQKQYALYQACHPIDRNLDEDMHHLTPLFFAGTNLYRMKHDAKIYDNDVVTHALSKHSLLLALAADHLIAELNSGLATEVDISGNHLESQF
jgi:hypothetical protein